MWFVFRRSVRCRLLKLWWITLLRRTVSWTCQRETLYKCLVVLVSCVVSVDNQTTSQPLSKACYRITCWWQRTSLIMAFGKYMLLLCCWVDVGLVAILKVKGKIVEFHLTATGCHLPWDHTVLPATRHKWTRPAFTPASRPVLDLPTPEGWKAELT